MHSSCVTRWYRSCRRSVKSSTMTALPPLSNCCTHTLRVCQEQKIHLPMWSLIKPTSLILTVHLTSKATIGQHWRICFDGGGEFKPLAYTINMGPNLHVWAKASMPWKRLAHQLSFPCTDSWTSSLKANPLSSTQQASSHEFSLANQSGSTA